MSLKNKNIVFVILLIAVLFPTVTKLLHSSEHFICSSKDSNHFHKEHQECLVCIFQITSSDTEFSSGNTIKFIQQELICNNSTINFYFDNFYNLSQLRAPPELLF